MATHERFLQKIAKNYIEWEKRDGLGVATARVMTLVPDEDWLKFMHIKHKLQNEKLTPKGG